MVGETIEVGLGGDFVVISLRPSDSNLAASCSISLRYWTGSLILGVFPIISFHASSMRSGIECGGQLFLYHSLASLLPKTSSDVLKRACLPFQAATIRL